MDGTGFVPDANSVSAQVNLLRTTLESNQVETMQETLLKVVTDSLLKGNVDNIKGFLETTDLDLDLLLHQVFKRGILKQLYISADSNRFGARQEEILKEVDSLVEKYTGGAYRSDHFKGKGSLHTSNELVMWCVLTKRHKMAKLIWHRGEGALARALVASMLYRAMAKEAAEADDMLEIEKLENYADEFGVKALKLLDYCYRRDNGLTQELLTCKLPNWPGLTCLKLAYTCRNSKVISHPCF